MPRLRSGHILGSHSSARLVIIVIIIIIIISSTSDLVQLLLLRRRDDDVAEDREPAQAAAKLSRYPPHASNRSGGAGLRGRLDQLLQVRVLVGVAVGILVGHRGPAQVVQAVVARIDVDVVGRVVSRRAAAEH